MRLYGYHRSTATWRVRIALAYKQLPYEYVPVHLTRGGGEQHRPEFRALNPMGHVPVLELEHAGKLQRVAESPAILELLEELWPSPALLPREPFARARVRQLASLVISGIQPLQNLKVQRYLRAELGADELAFCRHWVGLGLEALEALTKETAGRFSLGDELTLADVCLVPQLAGARRFNLDLSPFPTLCAIDAACAELEAFKQALPENQPDAETKSG